MQKRLNLWKRLKPEYKDKFKQEYKEKSYFETKLNTSLKPRFISQK